MITVIVTGRTARAFSDDVVTIESAGFPVRFVFSDEWEGLEKTAYFAAGNIWVDVQLNEDSCSLPAAVLTASGSLRLGVYGFRSGVAIPSTRTEVLVLKGVTSEDLAALNPVDLQNK